MAGYSRAVNVFRAGLVGAVWVLGCGDSAGPSDTTVQLLVDAVTSPTNQPTQTIRGTTDSDATVTLTGPADTVSGPAGGGGAFALTINLAVNALNTIAVSAEDRAGNRRNQTVTILHDDIAPLVTFSAPAAGGTTAGQSAFTIELGLADESSGVDETTFEITSTVPVGGVFQQDGTFTPTQAASTNLASLFSTVSASGATWLVSDAEAFASGPVQLTARIADLAGNPSVAASRGFEVGPDPDKLIVVDASGSAGSEVAVVIGLANAFEVSGVQFDLMYDTNVIASVDSVTVGDRAVDFDSTPFNEIAPGQVRVLLFDLGGDRVAPGQGPILNLWLTVDAAAPAGGHALTLDSITVSDAAGGTSSAAQATGTFTVQ